MHDELPPLPEPSGYWSADLPPNYTAEQMHAYAASAIDSYKAQLLRTFEMRHADEKHRHNWWGCLAREFKDGDL